MSKVRVLCVINDTEGREYSEAISNRQTFIILKNILLEQHMLDDIDNIDKKIKGYSLQVDSWWEKITEKYEIPYFLDNSLGVDLNRNEVYVTIKEVC